MPKDPFAESPENKRLREEFSRHLDAIFGKSNYPFDVDWSTRTTNPNAAEETP